MMCRIKFTKPVVYRVLAFSLTFIVGFTTFLLIPSSNVTSEKAKTYILQAEIYNRKNVSEEAYPRPNPLILKVAVDKNRNVTLNREYFGNLEDTSILEKKISNVFKDRENSGVFRYNSNEIEKQIFVYFDKSIKYGELVELVETLNRLGANPVTLDPNNENRMSMGSGCGFKVTRKLNRK